MSRSLDIKAIYVLVKSTLLQSLCDDLKAKKVFHLAQRSIEVFQTRIQRSVPQRQGMRLAGAFCLSESNVQCLKVKTCNLNPFKFGTHCVIHIDFILPDSVSLTQ